MEDFRDLDAHEVADMVEIQDLLARYTRLVDIGDTAGWLELFTDDCSYVVHGRTYEGKAGVKEMITLAAPNGVHLGAAPVIRLHGASASASQSFFAILADRKTTRIGWYEDDLSKKDGRWRIASRRVTFVRSDGSLRPPI
ncbi:nuclear transport factor 2 family protein [Streptomyces sp. NPDC057363]|uniref:nuclear transport factor 2 family protein n=1 Tax=Streptomyces sp. NPDC057363 TaxID=3346107 RepID=UPI00362A5D0A